MEKNDKDILNNLNNFEMFKKHISIIEDILKYYSLPLSLRQKVENKISKIKKDIKIKNKIIEYYNENKHLITIENIISMLHNILDFSEFNLLESTKNTSFDQINELISNNAINKKIIINILENFIKCDKFIKVDNLSKPKKFFDYSLLTKAYLNKEKNIKDNNKAIQYFPKYRVLKSKDAVSFMIKNNMYIDAINFYFILQQLRINSKFEEINDDIIILEKKSY